jgi:hypothetical protein
MEYLEFRFNVVLMVVSFRCRYCSPKSTKLVGAVSRNAGLTELMKNTSILPGKSIPLVVRSLRHQMEEAFQRQACYMYN